MKISVQEGVRGVYELVARKNLDEDIDVGEEILLAYFALRFYGAYAQIKITKVY